MDQLPVSLRLSAFGLNLLTPRLATLVRTDMPLALVIFLIGLLIWKKIQRQDEWNVRDRVYLFALLTSLNVNQRPDCLRLFASRDCALSVAW